YLILPTASAPMPTALTPGIGVALSFTPTPSTPDGGRALTSVTTGKCFACFKRLITLDQMKQAKHLPVVTDVNAVPPSGVEGVGVNDNATPIPGVNAVGIGALAVGNIKYKTEAGLFKEMIETEKPIYLDFREAYTLAQKLAS